MLAQVLNGRKTALCSALEKQFGDLVSFQAPRGGYFVWLSFHDGVDTREFLNLARAEGVEFCPGALCTAVDNGQFKNALRLSFAFYSDRELDRSICRLRVAFEKFVENRSSKS